MWLKNYSESRNALYFNMLIADTFVCFSKKVELVEVKMGGVR